MLFLNPSHLYLLLDPNLPRHQPKDKFSNSQTTMCELLRRYYLCENSRQVHDSHRLEGGTHVEVHCSKARRAGLVHCKDAPYKSKDDWHRCLNPPICCYRVFWRAVETWAQHRASIPPGSYDYHLDARSRELGLIAQGLFETHEAQCGTPWYWMQQARNNHLKELRLPDPKDTNNKYGWSW